MEQELGRDGGTADRHAQIDGMSCRAIGRTALDGKALIAVLVGHLRYGVIRSLNESPGKRMGGHGERMDRWRQDDQKGKAQGNRAPAPAQSPARGPVPSGHVKLQRIMNFTGTLYQATSIRRP
jgi:hypothetical protein